MASYVTSRRSMRRPRIDTSSADAVAGLVGLVAQLVAKGASDKLILKEKRDAQSLTVLAEKYHSITKDLTRVESEYDVSKRLYESALGKVAPINRTTGSGFVTDNLEQSYLNEIDVRLKETAKLKNAMNQYYSEMADIGRVQAGLLKSVTPEAGIPGEYDIADFSTKRLAKIFNVDEALIDKYRTKQPERFPTAIAALEKIRLEQVVTKKGAGVVESKRLRDKQMDFISGRIANAPIFLDMAAIAGSTLSDDDKRKAILNLGEDRGAPLSIIIDPANEPQAGDSKKVRKEKREKQYTKATYLLNTFTSFTKKTGYKDVVGLGKLVESLSYKADVEIKPENRPGFKSLIKEYYNINLDKKEHFMLPGYILEEGVPVKGAASKSIMKHSAEEVIAYMWENSGLSRTEFMKDKTTMARIQKIYADLYPGMSNDEMDIRIEKLFNSLISKKDKTI